MSRPRVLITHRPFDETVELLAEHCDVEVNQTPGPLSPEELRTRASAVDGLLVFMPDRIDADLLAACPRIRVIAAALKGYDNIDVTAARERGITVTIVEDLLTEPTAELAIALLLAAARRIREGDELVRSGRFCGWRPELYGLGLSGAQVGLLGFGAIGQAIARRLTGFGCQLMHTDPAATAIGPAGSRRVDLEELFISCDAIVVSAPLLPHTVGMVDAAHLSLMGDYAILVNVGRGSVVDEQAVAAALSKGRLGAYAADVFAFEDASRPDRPPSVSPALLEQERTVFTPHLGSATTAARRAIERRAAESVLQALVTGPVNH